MACGCEGSNRRTVAPFRHASNAKPNEASRSAVAAAVSPQYEVITGRGTATGRKFGTLLAAQQYASAIGGSTRPI